MSKKMSVDTRLRLATVALMADAHRVRVGAAIRQRRQELDLSVETVAARVPVAEKTLRRWEKGESFGHMDNLERLAEALETTVAALMAGPERERAADTPALLRTMDGGKDDLTERLDRIERGQEAIAQRLDYLFEVMDTAADEAADAETQANGQRSARTPGRRTPGAEPPAR